MNTDRDEYSRYPMEPGDTRNIVGAYLTFQGASSTDSVDVRLVRTSGYTDGGTQMLASATISVANNPSHATVSFNVETITENQPYNPPSGPGSDLIAPATRDSAIYRGVAGTYQVQAAVNPTASPPGPTAQSPPFRVTVIPSEELRHLWLRGVPLQALDVVAPLFQPQQITGVRIRDTGQSTLEGVYPLALTVGTSTTTISWATGPPQIVAGSARQTVVCQSADQQSYVVLDVNPWQLPPASRTESILVGGSQFTDADLQKYVDYATHTLESAWYFFAEPHTSDTDPALSTPGTPILQQRSVVPQSYHVEHQEVPMTYRRPRDFAHWMSFSLPRRQIQAVYYLYGYFNQSQAVSIGRDWVVFDPITGTLELVPDNGAIISWQFYGAAILQFFINYDTIPSFWHFGLASGLNHLHGEYQIVREAIAKQASANILSAAGFSLSGGAQTRSVSRDGVSDSRTYAGKQAGGELRAQYEEWLTKNIRRIGQRYGGVPVQFV